jgi:hypothetical protein
VALLQQLLAVTGPVRVEDGLALRGGALLSDVGGDACQPVNAHAIKGAGRNRHQFAPGA